MENGYLNVFASSHSLRGYVFSRIIAKPGRDTSRKSKLLREKFSLLSNRLMTKQLNVLNVYAKCAAFCEIIAYTKVCCIELHSVHESV